MSFPVVDIIIVIAFLAAGYLGYHKGLLKSLLGLFGNVIALVCSYFLKGPVTELVDAQWHFSEAIGGFLLKLLPMPESFFTTMASITGMGQLYNYLETSLLPKSIKEGILASVQEQVNTIGAGVYATMADVISNTIAYSVLTGLVFLALWFLLSLLFMVAGQFFGDVVHGLPLIGFVDRAGGAVVSMSVVLLVVIVVYHVIHIPGFWEVTPLSESILLESIGGLFAGGVK